MATLDGLFKLSFEVSNGAGAAAPAGLTIQIEFVNGEQTYRLPFLSKASPSGVGTPVAYVVSAPAVPSLFTSIFTTVFSPTLDTKRAVPASLNAMSLGPSVNPPTGPGARRPPEAKVERIPDRVTFETLPSKMFVTNMLPCLSIASPLGQVNSVATVETTPVFRSTRTTAPVADGANELQATAKRVSSWMATCPTIGKPGTANWRVISPSMSKARMVPWVAEKSRVPT